MPVPADRVVHGHDVALEDLVCVLGGTRLTEQVLRHDDPDHAVSVADAPHHFGLEVVCVIGRALGGGADVCRHDRHGPAGVDAIEFVERLGDGVTSHVTEVHDDAVVAHRRDRSAAEVGEAAGGLVEGVVVLLVGEHRQRRRVGRDAAKEQVGECDVEDAAAGELRDLSGDAANVGTEVKTAFDAMHESASGRRRARRGRSRF